MSRDYLFYFLRTPDTVNLATSRCSGANLPRLSPKQLASFKIPLPPFAEQKRIAGILDAADALRAKRREALAQLDTLLQSTFLDIFGDPVTNPMGWEERGLGELTQDTGFRNGLSPIVNPRDRRSARSSLCLQSLAVDSTSLQKKSARFDKAPSPSQRLSTDTFLDLSWKRKQATGRYWGIPRPLIESCLFPRHDDRRRDKSKRPSGCLSSECMAYPSGSQADRAWCTNDQRYPQGESAAPFLRRVSGSTRGSSTSLRRHRRIRRATEGPASAPTWPNSTPCSPLYNPALSAGTSEPLWKSPRTSRS